MTPPIHLARFNMDPDDKFDSGELLFRRHPCGQPVMPKQYFPGVSWMVIMKGISLNRSKHCNTPMDVLWVAEEKNGACLFNITNGRVISLNSDNFPIKDPKTGAELILKHTPQNCNYSHCDIFIKNFTSEPNKPTQKDIRAFLSTFFDETDISNC